MHASRTLVSLLAVAAVAPSLAVSVKRRQFGNPVGSTEEPQTNAPQPSACASSPCMNGGACLDTPLGGFECNCLPGFDGTYCDKIVEAPVTTPEPPLPATTIPPETPQPEPTPEPEPTPVVAGSGSGSGSGSLTGDMYGYGKSMKFGKKNKKNKGKKNKGGKKEKKGNAGRLFANASAATTGSVVGVASVAGVVAVVVAVTMHRRRVAASATPEETTYLMEGVEAKQ